MEVDEQISMKAEGEGNRVLSPTTPNSMNSASCRYILAGLLMSVGTAPLLSTLKQNMELTSINTIRNCRWVVCRRRILAIPETPMSMAPVADCLWQNFLRFDPQDLVWPKRNRFELSVGHASMLLHCLPPPQRGAGSQQRLRNSRRGVGANKVRLSAAIQSGAGDCDGAKPVASFG